MNVYSANSAKSAQPCRTGHGAQGVSAKDKPFVWTPESGNEPGSGQPAIVRLPVPIFKVKEVIQPQVPLRLPCYDLVPVMNHTVVTVLPKVRLATSGATHFHDVTGGVYKARERIHRDVLIRDY